MFFFLNENNFYVEWLVVSQFQFFFKGIFFIFQVGLWVRFASEPSTFVGVFLGGI